MAETAILETTTYEHLGRMLRDARLSRRMELQDIAQALHIRPRYLEALEDGTLEQLPGDAFVIGYMSRYAAHLGLAAERLVEEYRNLGTLPQRRLLNIPDGMRQQQHPGIVLVLITLSMAVVLMMAWTAGIRHAERLHPMPQVLKPEAVAEPQPVPSLTGVLGCVGAAETWPPCYDTARSKAQHLPRKPLKTIMELGHDH